MCLIKHNIIKM